MFLLMVMQCLDYSLRSRLMFIIYIFDPSALIQFSTLFLKLNLESLHLSENFFSQKSHLILFCCYVTYSSIK